MQWQQEWLALTAAAQRELWRGVEAQHQVATMRLVDTLEEQQLLEQLLGDSKPPLPPSAEGQHWLIFTPFRYTSPHATRFRSAYEPGVWYGADSPQTVAAELALWRWRFVCDSHGLREQAVLTEHTFFCAEFSGMELDLMVEPWSQLRELWTDEKDYSVCQALAKQVRNWTRPRIAAIRYESVRQPRGFCQAVFDPRALRTPAPLLQQTWICKTTQERVMFSHERDTFEYLFLPKVK